MTLFLLLGFLFVPSSIYASTYTVTKTADTNDGTCDADCSLREALAAANANSGADTIAFSIPTSDGGYTSSSDDWTITLSSGLTISANQSVSFDGTTQTGSTSIPTYGGKIIVLITTNITAITSNSGSDLTINHVTFKSTATASSPGFIIRGTVAALDVQNSYFTRDAQSTANNYAIDGPITITGNVVFSNNKIEYWRRGFQGTNTNSSATLTFDSNVLISPTSIGFNATGYNISVTNNTITSFSDQAIVTSCTGGTCTISNNTITDTSTTSFSRSLALTGAGTFSVTGNNINTPNNRAISLSSAGTISNNTIQGTSGSTTDGKIHVNTNNTSKPITISNNTISVSNAIPIWVTGDSTRASIQNNTISTTWTYTPININGGSENSAFVTANDFGDSDAGPNNLMNYPVINHVDYVGGGYYHIYGNLDRNLSEGGFSIEVCESNGSLSGYGGCSSSLGTTTEVNASGAWDVKVKISDDDGTKSHLFSALATNGNGSTSEFGPNIGYVPPEAQTQGIEISAFGTGVVTKNGISAILEKPVIPFDAYLSISKSGKQGAGESFTANDTTYWQVSPVYEIWWKAHFNDARILTKLLTGTHIFSISYKEDKLENLPEKNLQLAFSEDTKRWRLLNSVLDITNKTAATLTKTGGYYMLVSGYPVISSATGSDVQGVTKTSQPPEARQIRPLPSPNPTPTPRSETKPFKNCFLFWCW